MNTEIILKTTITLKTEYNNIVIRIVGQDENGYIEFNTMVDKEEFRGAVNKKAILDKINGRDYLSEYYCNYLLRKIEKLCKLTEVTCQIQWRNK